MMFILQDGCMQAGAMNIIKFAVCTQATFWRAEPAHRLHARTCSRLSTGSHAARETLSPLPAVQSINHSTHLPRLCLHPFLLAVVVTLGQLEACRVDVVKGSNSCKAALFTWSVSKLMSTGEIIFISLQVEHILELGIVCNCLSLASAEGSSCCRQKSLTVYWWIW